MKRAKIPAFGDSVKTRTISLQSRKTEYRVNRKIFSTKKNQQREQSGN